MTRQARIDAPGALHRIMCRGIERGRIFLDETDRDHFVERLAALLSSTSTSCFAWALIPNHFRLLVRTGCVPVSTVMRRLPTSYAVHFNRRHHRSGHVFQNRYKVGITASEEFAERMGSIPADLRFRRQKLAYTEYSTANLSLLGEVQQLLDHPKLNIKHKQQLGRLLISLKALADITSLIEDRMNRMLLSLQSGEELGEA